MNVPALAAMVGEDGANLLETYGIVDAYQLQGMLAHPQVRLQVGALLRLDPAALANLDARLAADGLDPAAITPAVLPPAGVGSPPKIHTTR
jgi:hypothetical protein